MRGNLSLPLTMKGEDSATLKQLRDRCKQSNSSHEWQSCPAAPSLFLLDSQLTTLIKNIHVCHRKSLLNSTCLHGNVLNTTSKRPVLSAEPGNCRSEWAGLRIRWPLPVDLPVECLQDVGPGPPREATQDGVPHSFRWQKTACSAKLPETRRAVLSLLSWTMHQALQEDRLRKLQEREPLTYCSKSQVTVQRLYLFPSC